MFNDKLYNQKMDKTFDVFTKELSSLRTGRANSSMLDIVKVDVYGQKMPINQLGSVTTPEPRMINVQVWDLNNVNLIDSAIKKSELGLNPQIDGQLIRLPIPDLSEERREEIKKMIKTMGEKCKVSIRNIRREANDDLKNLLKKKEISASEVLESSIERIEEVDGELNALPERCFARAREVANKIDKNSSSKFQPNLLGLPTGVIARKKNLSFDTFGAILFA